MTAGTRPGCHDPERRDRIIDACLDTEPPDGVDVLDAVRRLAGTTPDPEVGPVVSRPSA
jgi:hypothetical protein